MRSRAGWLLVSLCSGVAVACPDAAPITERPANFVALSKFAPEIRQDIRYATPDNFVGTVVDGYEEPECWLTRPAAVALKQAHLQLLRQGWALKVYDCYRPQRAVAHFMRWSESDHTSTKSRYYPRLDKATLLSEVYIAACSGHSRGSTVDVGLIPLGSRVPRMDEAGCGAIDRQAAEMGTGFDCFDVRANTTHAHISATARRHRQVLKSAMDAAGFRNYDKEWWHYTLTPEPYSRIYFDFPVN